ncbi:hypothetical protein M0805_003024 [Coniferiporia weirii]|nr:hypothetical protein M0805_003024 [Coniferiporia weirii]
MSVTPELLASARATYRALFRAASCTFKGDDRVLNAFREKVRTEFREGRSQSNPDAFTARIQLGREVANVLRSNVVQGVKIRKETGLSSAESQAGSMVQDEHGVWRLRITEHTELGSNESIKTSPSPSQLRKSGRRQQCCSSAASAHIYSSLMVYICVLQYSAFYSTSSLSELRVKETRMQPESELVVEERRECPEGLDPTQFVSDVPPNGLPPDTSSLLQDHPRKLNFSALKRAHQSREKPELNENDLEESFVRGSGPGGQSINKTQNNVQLLHKPTGIRVSCQETRSLQQNRLIARKILLERLDRIANPGLSKEDLKRAKQVERERRRRKKAKKKARAKSSEESEDE